MLILLSVLSLPSCTPTKSVVFSKSKIKYEIVQRPFITYDDTIYINEMQFYPIDSAFDIQAACYNNFGKWDLAYDGKYNPGIQQLIWNSVKLFDTDQEFKLLTDGEESGTEYFSAVMVFDTKSKDALTEDNPQRQTIIDRLVLLMQNRGPLEEFLRKR